MSAYEAVRIRLDPTPRQTRLLESHAGGARFAYNLMLAHVQRQISLGEKPDWTLYAMRRWWNEWKDEIAPWWRENSKEAYSSAFEWLSQALRNWSDSRKGRRAGRMVGWPKYKSKRSSVPRFAYTTGSFGLIEDDPKALKLPRIGRVHCMENATERVHGRRIVRSPSNVPPKAFQRKTENGRTVIVRSAWIWASRPSPPYRMAPRSPIHATTSARNGNSATPNSR